MTGFKSISLLVAGAFALVACTSETRVAQSQAAFVNPQEASAALAEQKSEIFVPFRRITKQPGFHWFAYYDKLEADPTGRYVLAMRTDFEGRTPTDKDIIEIGMVDTLDNDKWIRLGESRAWGWQQGCQLQFVPNTKSKIIWNDRVDGKFVAHIMDIETREVRTIPSSVYALSPDGKWAITVDYARVNDMRPGYGYKGRADKFAAEKAPKDSGIWKVNLETGESKLIVSIADAVAVDNPLETSFRDAKHWFNHLLVSPDGKRFIFLNRWRYGDERDAKYRYVGGFGTRMFTASMEGGDLRVIDPYNYTSHFIWDFDSKNVLAWTKIPPYGFGFFLIADSPKGGVEQIGKGIMPVNGHCTYINREWILNDTYPQKPSRQQIVYLYNVKTGKRVEVAKLHSPKGYYGEWRCDTHPRAIAGNKVVVDSPHNGGRQLYIFDVSSIINPQKP